MKNNFDQIVQHLVSQGFFFLSSSIYGGLANAWDYGPLGIELKHNLKNLLWWYFVTSRSDMVGYDSTIITHPEVWKASGHVKNFKDFFVDCKACKKRFRFDELIEKQVPTTIIDQLNHDDYQKILAEHNITCLNCKAHDFTDVRSFDLMFKTQQGALSAKGHSLYLRPETTQGIFINFKNILRTTRKKIPFGVGQIGKSFRNEITPSNFIFRTREFEQFEIAFFCTLADSELWFSNWMESIQHFLMLIGLQKQNTKIAIHPDSKLAHYAIKTSDVEYKFPFGWKELWGLSNRGEYDLQQHSQYSNEKLDFFDSDINQRFTPAIIEPSVGIDRLVLALLCDAFCIEKLADGSERLLLKLIPPLAPVQVLITPLVKKLNDQTFAIYKRLLTTKLRVNFDNNGSIGKRYRRADAIGVKYVVTYDFQSLDDQMVTIRERDSMLQKRIAIHDLESYLESHLNKVSLKKPCPN